MFTFRRPPVHQRPRRRAVPLRLDTFEERTVPAAVIGVNISPIGSATMPPLGNSGAVGPSHFVQFTSINFTVFNQAGNQLLQQSHAGFWTAAGIPATTVDDLLSQPRIVYDAISNRWFAAAVTLTTTGNFVLVGRSDTADPTGTWKAVSYVATTTGFGNFPTLGVDANGVYIGTGDFTSGGSGGAAAGSTMTSIPKADLLAATPSLARKTTVTQFHFPPFSFASMGWAPQAVTNYDGTDTTASVVATHYSSFNLITYWEISGSGAANATFGSAFDLSIPYNALPGESRQPDGTRDMSGGEDDHYSGAIYQVGDLIYAAHAISVNGSGAGTDEGPTTTNGIQLIVLRDSTNQVVATGTYFNPAYDYTFPSLAANQHGDILIGLNRSGGSGSTNGNLGAYAVHARINPANPTSISFLEEVPLKAGQVNDYNFAGTVIEPWGPYSATSVDPTNPFEFWTTQQYVKGTTEWGTQVSQVYVSPRALSVTSPVANGTYGAGAVIPIEVKFNGAVAVIGSPQLALSTGGTAVYASGSGSDTLTFNYTVAASHASPDLDYDSAAALTLNGGSINLADAGVAVPAELTLPTPGAAGSLGASKDLVIESSAAASEVTSPTANGTHLFGATILIDVAFSKPVVVTGSPRLALNAGGTATATYTSGTGTSTLRFTYTVQAGHTSADLDYASTSALTLNGGTITDEGNGAAAGLTLPAPGAAGSLGANKALVIDALPASVTGVTSPTADGTYGVGIAIPITVTFNRAVAVTGSPQLALNTGAIATYTGGSNSTTLTFTYTVGAGQNTTDLDYASAAALTLNGGTIIEVLSSQNANLTLAAPSAVGSLGASKNIAIDTVRALVLNVTSPTANGSYAIGGVIDVTVQFDRAVDVTGSPQLALNSGGSASYLSGSGSTTLTFRYTVGSGEATADLDYASTGALTLNGGTIKGLNGADANLGLTAPGGTGSLGANKAIVVDGVGPTVLEFRVLFGSKRFNVIGSSRVLPWLVTGVQVVFNEPVTAGNVRSLTGLNATRFTGLRTKTLTWNFPATAKGSFNASLASSGLNALRDKAGNPVANFTQAFQVLYGDFNGDAVVNAADEAGVRAHLSGPYQLSPSGYNIFADLSGDGLVNLVDVNITKTRRGQSLP